MSIIHANDYGWIISHFDFISKVYENTNNENKFQKYALRGDLFDISSPFKIHEHLEETKHLQDVKDLPKKRKANRMSKDIDPVAERLKKIYEIFLDIAKSSACDYFDGRNSPVVSGNVKARCAAKFCTDASICLKNMGLANGGNTATFPLYQKCLNCDILIPPNCRFHTGDVRCTMSNIAKEDFDLVIMDPPWWNKYIRRSKAKKPDSSYEMLYNEEVANLPLEGMLSPGAMLAVWCTNCSSHETAIKELMFSSWGVQYAATWFWLKVTKTGSPVCPFSETNGKQPFERIIIGFKNPAPHQLKPPKDRIVVSIPSALHSHKPPLNDLLAPYLSSEAPKCLEVFARYLLPNTTSIGLEPLRWQHSSLYELQYAASNEESI